MEDYEGEVYLRTFDKPGVPATYIGRVRRSVAVDEHRIRSQEVSLDNVVELEEPHANPEAWVLQQERSEAIQTVVKTMWSIVGETLDPANQHLFYARLVERRPYKELVGPNETVGAVKTRFHRLREKVCSLLRERLSREYPEVMEYIEEIGRPP